MEEKSRRRLIINILVMVFLNLAFILAAYYLSLSVKAKENLVRQYKTESALCEKRTERVNELRVSLGEADKEIKIVEAAFIGEDSLVDFIEELEFLAEHANLQLEKRGIAFSAGKDRKPVFSIALQGSFGDIYQYLLLLENDVCRIAFERADIHKVEGTESWEALLELRVLTFR